MSDPQADISTYISAVQGAEDQLAAALYETVHEVSHAERFNDEQRSEIYTILDTLKADTQAHRATVKLLAHRITLGTGNA